MKTEAKKLPKNTLQIDVTIPVKNVKATKEEVLAQVVENAEVPGFRKGKAPREKVLETIDPAKINGEVINELIQRYVPQALKEHHVVAVSSPKVEVTEFDEEKDLKFAVKIATKPEVNLKDYKPELKKRTKEKTENVQKEKEEKLKKGEKFEDVEAGLTPSEVMEVLLKNVTIEIAEILIEEEVNRMMARLVDQIRAIGMTVQQYLQSQGKSQEEIKKEYEKVAEENIRAEFVLAHLVEKLDIKVADEEVENMINAAGDEKVKEQFQSERQKWYIKSILSKNKVISLLIEEAKS